MASENATSQQASGSVLVNRLGASRSPYVCTALKRPSWKPFRLSEHQQVRGHMNNPVSWQLWDANAFALAKQLNRLIFVSIGYAACHWCHVMERESFESSEVADILNNHFVPIKIDREERPDVDAVYMQYVQATTGSGGWPLSLFLLPTLEPVFGGTYFPGPKSSMRPKISDHTTFPEILLRLKAVWEENEGKCRDSAKEITRQLRTFAEEGVHSRKDDKDREDLELELLEDAFTHFKKRFDHKNGGFASAPKFPTAVNLRFLLNLSHWPETVKDIVGEDECREAQEMSLQTLRSMSRGGIHDQIGRGFCRYSVTKDWSLPHFEKMLYDQAQLLDVYLDAFLLDQNQEMFQVVQDIADYLVSPPIIAPGGGFFSSEDADSLPSNNAIEKREGAFYVWSYRDFCEVLGSDDGKTLAEFYGVKPNGNVDPHNDPHGELKGQNVLKMSGTVVALSKELRVSEQTAAGIIESGREKLREHRDARRPRPDLDDKIVVCWNGLAISALARTGSALLHHEPNAASKYLDAALSAAKFIKAELFDKEERKLFRVYRGGRADTVGMCEDYAFLIQGLIDLYEATFDDEHLHFADDLQKIQLDCFWDRDGGGAFFTAGSPHPPDILLRLKNGMDAAEPSSNSVSARNLWRLSGLLEDETYAKMARNTLLAFEAELEQFPFTFANMLFSVAIGRIGLKNIVLSGDISEHEKILREIRARVRPNTTIVALDGSKGSWLRGRNPLLKHLRYDTPQVMVCKDHACQVGIQHVW